MELELGDVLATFIDDWLPSNDDGITDCDSEDRNSKEGSEKKQANALRHRRRKVENLKRLVSKKVRPSKPRMLSSDIRDSYASMFANTFNSCDLFQISGMCKRFYMPNVQVAIRKQVDNTQNMFTDSGIGPMFIANMLYVCSTWSPDAVTTLRRSNFNVDSGVVSFNFTFSATKAYNVTSIHDAVPSMRMKGEEDPATAESNNTKELSEEDIVRNFEKVKASMPLRKNPVKVVFRCNVKLITNEHKRVEKFKLSIYVVENDFSVENQEEEQQSLNQEQVRGEKDVEEA